MAKRKTNEEFLKETYDLVGDEYDFLEGYQKSNIKLKVRHNKCGNVYQVTPNNFLKGKRCPYCNGGIVYQQNQIEKRIKELYGDEYTLLNKYENAHSKLNMRHNICGYIWKTTTNNFLKGHGCPNCNKGIKKTNQEFRKEVYDLVGDEYTFLEPYQNTHTKLNVKHNKCGNVYQVEPNKFLLGRRCPYCYQSGSSHGNEIIAKYLDEHNINYEREYRFEDCVYKRPLPFDFYLKEYNVAIEYDGEQHYSPNDFFEGHDPFKERQLKDRIKSKYCYQNNIKLIRIKYTQFNEIEDILNKELTN